MNNFGSPQHFTPVQEYLKLLIIVQFQSYVSSVVHNQLRAFFELALALRISYMWLSQICALHIHVLTGEQEQFTLRLTLLIGYRVI